MSGAREFLEQLQQGMEVNFPEQAIKLPLATRSAITQALLAAISPLAPAPLHLPLMVSEYELWLLSPPYAHHVAAATQQRSGGHILEVAHEAYPSGSLVTITVRTRYQVADRGKTDLLSATLAFGFAASKPFEISADYQGEDRSKLSPRAILAFAQALLMLAKS